MVILILLGHIFDDRIQRCSRSKIGMDISTNRQIRKMRFSILGVEDDVEKKASK